jgi:hypothetical protein
MRGRVRGVGWVGKEGMDKMGVIGDIVDLRRSGQLERGPFFTEYQTQSDRCL